jgi:hypothetical protein
MGLAEPLTVPDIACAAADAGEDDHDASTKAAEAGRRRIKFIKVFR